MQTFEVFWGMIQTWLLLMFYQLDLAYTYSNKIFMRNLYFGVLLAPYRVDYYNYIHDNMNCDIYFQLRGFEGQLYSTNNLINDCTYIPRYLNVLSIGDRHIPKGIRKIINESEPEFVIVPEFSILTIIVVIIRELFGYKYKIVSQCDDSYAMLVGKGFSRVHAWSRKLCMRFIDDVILLDSRAEKWYQEKYGKGIYMPLIKDERRITESVRGRVQIKAESLKEKFGLDNVKTILFVGRLIEVKNLFSLIDACNRLDFPYKLFVVGDGMLREDLERYAQKENVDATFVGQRNGDDLYAWYRVADCFVLPSTMEAFGAVTNEALLFGCNCCISEKAGSACLIEEGVNGYTCNPNSTDDIANAIKKALQLKRSGNKMPVNFAECMERVRNSTIVAKKSK